MLNMRGLLLVVVEDGGNNVVGQFQFKSAQGICLWGLVISLAIVVGWLGEINRNFVDLINHLA
jgi:hypothetical protein